MQIYYYYFYALYFMHIFKCYIQQVWDLYQKFVTHQFKFDASKIEALRFHPTKTVLAAASSNNNVRVYDLETKRFVTQLSGHLSTVTSLMFLSDDVLLTGGKDKVIKVWEGFDDVFRMSGEQQLCGNKLNNIK